MIIFLLLLEYILDWIFYLYLKFHLHNSAFTSVEYFNTYSTSAVLSLRIMCVGF